MNIYLYLSFLKLLILKDMANLAQVIPLIILHALLVGASDIYLISRLSISACKLLINVDLPVPALPSMNIDLFIFNICSTIGWKSFDPSSSKTCHSCCLNAYVSVLVHLGSNCVFNLSLLSSNLYFGTSLSWQNSVKLLLSSSLNGKTLFLKVQLQQSVFTSNTLPSFCSISLDNLYKLMFSNSKTMLYIAVSDSSFCDSVFSNT